LKRLIYSIALCAVALGTSASFSHALPVEIHRHRHHAKKHTVPVVSRVNINEGSRSELLALPGIDEATADRIIEGRPWGSGKEMVAKGVLTDEQYEKVRLRISTKIEKREHEGTVSGSEDHRTVPVVKRLNLNEASREDLMALPGIDAATADRIIAGRPWGSGQELVNKGVLTSEQYDKIHLRISTKVDTDDPGEHHH